MTPEQTEVPMTEWVYKATQARARCSDARDLAVLDHFLCRAAFVRCAPPESMREAGLVGDVALGDVIHYYYRTPDGNVRVLGSFRVVDGSAFPGVFDACAGRGALVQVRETPENRRMIVRLVRGYSHDPRLAAFTGWALEKLSTPTPGFDQARMFPTRTTSLWRYPDPALPTTGGPVRDRVMAG
jgi:hypothetical protein